jgi:hypothetical protein
MVMQQIFNFSLLEISVKIEPYIKKRADALTNLPPGQGGRESGCGLNFGNQAGAASALHKKRAFFMTAATQIHPDKVRAYLATGYRIGHTSQDIVLTIGQRSERLAALFVGNSVDCGAFLTAYNPQGTVQSDAANDQVHAELARKLQALGLQAIEGSGSEEGTDWPSEKSYFALGLALGPAKEIGTYFDQDAIVWVDADAVPQLILLR